MHACIHAYIHTYIDRKFSPHSIGHLYVPMDPHASLEGTDSPIDSPSTSLEGTWVHGVYTWDILG